MRSKAIRICTYPTREKLWHSIPIHIDNSAFLTDMQIRVKTLTGRDIQVDIDPTDKVICIKQMMEEKEGIPPLQQRLIFNGSQLNDEKTLVESGIGAGAALHLVLTLRGG